MHCEPFDQVVDGQRITGMVCGVRRRSKPCEFCGKPATLQCDGPPPSSVKRKTCDAWLCRDCAVHIGPNRDLCPPHAYPIEASNAL